MANISQKEIKKNRVDEIIGKHNPTKLAVDAIASSIDLQIKLDCPADPDIYRDVYGSATLAEVAEAKVDHDILAAEGDDDGEEYIFFRGAMSVTGRGRTRERAMVHASARAAAHGFHGALY